MCLCYVCVCACVCVCVCERERERERVRELDLLAKMKKKKVFFVQFCLHSTKALQLSTFAAENLLTLLSNFCCSNSHITFRIFPRSDRQWVN